MWKEAWASLHGKLTLSALYQSARIASKEATSKDGRSNPLPSNARSPTSWRCLERRRIPPAMTNTTCEWGSFGLAGTRSPSLTRDNHGFTYDGVSTPLHHYTPIEMAVIANEPGLDYFWHVRDLAQDCVNQGGISNVLIATRSG